MPTAKKRRSTLADDAGTPRYCRAITSSLGNFALLLMSHQQSPTIDSGSVFLTLSCSTALEVRGELVSIFLLRVVTLIRGLVRRVRHEAARGCLAPLGRGVGGGEKWTKQALLDLELTAESCCSRRSHNRPIPARGPSRRRPGAAARGPYNVTRLGRGLNVSVCVAEAKRL